MPVILAYDGTFAPTDVSAMDSGLALHEPNIKTAIAVPKDQGEKMTTQSSSEKKFFKLTPVSRAVLMACGASLAVGGTPAVMAQEVAALDEIIVTARKRSENLQDVPISVQAFNAETIAKQGIRTLEDYARLIPSLSYSSWLPGASIVVFRGVTTTADAFSGNSSAATFFNEMPITSQGVNPEVAPVDMERIEAVSGPQPTTYGASAQSGVLKFVTAKPDLAEFGGFVEVAGSAMQEGDPSYDFQAAVNIPLIEDKLALRVAAKQSLVGGYVDNISGDSTQTHDWSPAFDSAPGLAAFPDGIGGALGIPRVTKTNHDVAEDNIGDIETQVLRVTAAWEANEDWLITGMYNYQSSQADGIASWNPELGDLNQIRFKNENRDDAWYVSTLVIEGDLGFADFTSATGYMDREIVYNLDQSTYLHQFQGTGAVYYNALDIAYFPTGIYYNDIETGNTNCTDIGAASPCYIPSSLTYFYPAYAGTITGWAPNGVNDNGYPTYLITELTDNTSRMYNKAENDRFSQELRLTSNDPEQRFQWMLGGFYERYETTYVFRGVVDNFGDSIAGHIIGGQGYVVRSPGQSWYGEGITIEKNWSVFGELGFDITDNFNILVGARYFDAETDDSNMTLNGDGTGTQNCLEDAAGDCIVSAGNMTPDNRVGIAPARNVSDNSDTLPLATISFSFSDDIKAYATYAEGFRVGGTNILRAVSTANDRFDPDKVINNEIGLKTTLWDGRFVWNMAAYKMTWEDMQMVAADPTISFGWGQVTVNTGEAEIEGFETNFALAATERLRFDGAFTYNTSEVTEGASIGDTVVVAVGEQLPLSPEIKWSLGAEYGYPVGNSDGYVRLDYSYTDEQSNATQGSTLLTSSLLLRGTITTMPSYSIANLVAGFGNESWSLRFALNNIADERAITYVPTRWTDGRQYSVRPREFTMTYRKNF
jgi:iron complex outermembrane receptor protein